MATTKRRKSESLSATITEEQYQLALSEYSENALKQQAIQLEIDEAVKEIMDEYNSDVEMYAAKQKLLFSTIKAYAIENREALMGDKAKSYDTLYGTLGFRKDPPSIKPASGVKIDTIIERLKEKGLTQYIRTVEELNKEQLLADREGDIAAQFSELGIKVNQEEKFYIELATTPVATSK